MLLACWKPVAMSSVFFHVSVVQASLVAYSLPGSCSFTVYNHTACTRNPYNTTTGTLEQCCEFCQNDNQCNAWTLHNPDEKTGVGQCLVAFSAEYADPKKPGITCGSRAPLSPTPSPGPGPSPSPIPHDFDCGIRRLALEFGQKVVAPINAAPSLYEALQLGPACGDAPPPASPTVTYAATDIAPGGTSEAQAQVDVWVSPTGSDMANGTSPALAWRSIARAVKWLASSPASTRPPTVVHLMPGTYYLDSTVELGAEHSGSSAASPVRWVAERTSGADAPVVVSGGSDLTKLTWEPAAADNLAAAASTSDAKVWKAVVDAAMWPSSESMTSLFADDQRQWRARWPNGNPEEYCARDHHGGNGCVGFAQASSSKTVQPTACTVNDCAANGGEKNVFIHSKESGNVIMTGVMEPYDVVHNFSVATPADAFHEAKVGFNHHEAFAAPANASKAQEGSFQLERFDTSITRAFWNTAVPSQMYAGSWTKQNWAHPSLTHLHTYQSEYWGSWIFQIANITAANDDTGDTHIMFSRGGFQEARGGGIGGKGGRGIGQDFFVAGAFEELDSAREFYHNASTRTLYWVPNTTTVSDPFEAGLTLVAPRLSVLLRVGGNGDAKSGVSELATHMRFEGIEFRHAAPTYMASYEPTSGGDWAVHRGAAVVVEWAEGIMFDRCAFAALEGNGLLLQHHVRNSSVMHSEFHNIGETPLMLLGSADGMNGTLSTQPWGNTMAHNYVHKWGIWGRQAAGYFEGLSGGNNVSFNIFHDGPRAGANFNDGFGGGLNFEGNLLFNVVQDTGEHGSTNSWDRQPMLWRRGGASDGALAAVPARRSIARNLVFRNSFRGATSNKWALDKDDGSSNYDEHGNVLLYGAVKDRDGLQRVVRDNLFLYPDLMPFVDTTNTHVAMAYQVNGYASDFFFNNTAVTAQGALYSCTSAGSFDHAHAANMHSNTFLCLADVDFYGGACGPKGWGAWQAAGFDANSTFTPIANGSSSALVSMARRWLPLM